MSTVVSRTREATDARPAVLALVFGLFFASGFSALVYQTAWQRMLGLFGGADTVAASLVVGAFLLGLGLGSLWASVFADRIGRRTAYVLFGLVEIGIGLFGAISSWVFYDVLFGRFVGVAQSPAVVFAAAFAGLLWPTILMGLSLPLLSRAIVRDIATSSRTIGWLYAVNTFGAALGTFAAGWWLIGTFGYEPVIWMAAAINVVVGVGALLVAMGQTEAGDGAAAGATGQRLRDTPGPVWRWCALVFVSGFLIISLQIVWYRLLGTMMQSSAYSFSLVLGLFLVGDAVGLVWGGALARRLPDPRRFFLWMQGATILYSILVIWAVWLAFGADAVSGQFVDRFVVVADWRPLLMIVSLTALVVLPGSLLIGMSFPLVQQAIQTDANLVGQRVGLIQLANIGGNSLGGIVTGLVLIHLFGTDGTIRLLLLAGLGFMVLLWATSVADRRTGDAALMAGLVALLVVFPAGNAFWSRLHGARAGEPTIVGEDRTGVVVLRHDGAGNGRVFIGGHAQSCIPFCTVHGFLGMIGPLAHPAPTDVLVIGVGSGGTPFGAGVRPETRHVHAIELVSPVYDVLRRYLAEEAGKPGRSAEARAGIGRMFSDPRFTLVVGDGRHLLYTDDRKWDVIEADAILPQTAHSGALYSIEYYEQLRSKLKPGGIAVQWAPTERAIATFLRVFPHVTMVHPAIIGSDTPIDVTREKLLAAIDRPDVVAYVRSAGMDVADLRSWFDTKRPEVWRPGDPRRGMDVNADLFPKDEYYLNNAQIFPR